VTGVERVVLASANPDKAAEIAAILAEVLPGVVVEPRPVDVPEVVEDGETLEQNARLKAVALCEATGMIAVADDTVSRSTRSRTRRASTPLDTRARMRPTPTTSTTCSPRW
jgi:hypothetical protein